MVNKGFPKPRWEGFTPLLQTPHDLFGKLEHDYRRMEAEPANVYPAFDFFVTAEHMPDWCRWSKRRKEAAKLKHPLLALVSHLGNGAKHFETTARIHQSVRTVYGLAGAFDARAFDAGAFQVGDVIIDREATSDWAAGEVDALSVARDVLAFWRTELKLPPSP